MKRFGVLHCWLDKRSNLRKSLWVLGQYNEHFSHLLVHFRDWMNNQLTIYIMGRLTMKLTMNSVSMWPKATTRCLYESEVSSFTGNGQRWFWIFVLTLYFRWLILHLRGNLYGPSITKIQSCPLKMALLASSAKTYSVLSAPPEQIQMGDKGKKTNTLTVLVTCWCTVRCKNSFSAPWQISSGWINTIHPEDTPLFGSEISA